MFAIFRQFVEELSSPRREETSLYGLRLDNRECCFDLDRSREAWQRALDEAAAWRPC